MEMNIVIGGEAGKGANAVAKIAAKTLAKFGYFAFSSKDYGSFIRGGHNFNTLTISDKIVMSNLEKIDVLVALDEEALEIHKPNLNKKGVVIKGETAGYADNMFFAGSLIKFLGLDFDLLKEELKELKDYRTNIIAAKKGYDAGKQGMKLERMHNAVKIIDGSQGIAQGAVKSGLDVYYAYPMTPSTAVLNELAEKQVQSNYFVFEPESEIAAINMAIGSAATGAKAMVGTSGGGFDLMTETLSLAGMTEIPIVIYLAQRPGPATGLPTYTSQGDLNLALNAGHGEFSRVVVAPGDPIEAEELTNQAFYFSQKYKVPAIVLSDAHLADSTYTFLASHGAHIVAVEKTGSLKRYNSNEAGKNMSATSEGEITSQNVIARISKKKQIEQEMNNFKTFRIYGNEKSKNIILFWGSTKGAVLDALKELKDAKALQVLYLEPFAAAIKEEIERAEEIFIVENNATSQLSRLVAEKTGVMIPEQNKILKFNGRAFASDELAAELKRRIR